MNQADEGSRDVEFFITFSFTFHLGFSKWHPPPSSFIALPSFDGGGREIENDTNYDTIYSLTTVGPDRVLNVCMQEETPISGECKPKY